ESSNVATLPATTFSYQVDSDSSTKWTYNSSYHMPFTIGSMYDYIVIDVNGDGLPDVLQAYNYQGTDHYNAWLNYGNNGWTQSTNYTPPILFYQDQNGSYGPSDQGVRVVD